MSSRYRRSRVTYVYRVENDEGEGPYEHGTPDCKFALPEVYYEFRPLPEDDFYPEDFRRILDEGLFFGFSDERGAVRWFTREGLRELARHGYRLRRVPARDVIRSASGYQVAFEPGEGYRLPSEVAPGYEFDEEDE